MLFNVLLVLCLFIIVYSCLSHLTSLTSSSVFPFFSSYFHELSALGLFCYILLLFSFPCALLCKVYMFESVVNWLCISSFTLVVFCHRCFTLSSTSLVLLFMICFCCVSHLLFQASVPLVFIVSVSPCLCRVVPHCCVYPSVVIPHNSWILFFVFRLCFFWLLQH